MAKESKIGVWRFNPRSDKDPVLCRYVVPMEDGDTVLQALLYIYEAIDSTLAFRYGCRLKKCGLCGVQVNGRPRLACLTRLRDGLVLRPLRSIPVIRDLVVDRSEIWASLKDLELYIPARGPSNRLQKIIEPPEHRHLMRCVECLCCLSDCSQYHNGGYGPYHFVKMAQFHFHPLNQVDRVAQAKRAGIDRCAECQKCYCPVGIPIYKDAILPLLGGGSRAST